MMLNKDACIQKMKRRLDELKSGIDKLEGKPHLAEVKIMTAHQSKMSALRLQLQKALVYLDEVKAAGEVNWEYLKAKTEKALDIIDNSLHDLKSSN
jgi:hypothetical protein